MAITDRTGIVETEKAHLRAAGIPYIDDRGRLDGNYNTDVTQLPAAGVIDNLPCFNVSGPQIGPQSLSAGCREAPHFVTDDHVANVRKVSKSKG